MTCDIDALDVFENTYFAFCKTHNISSSELYASKEQAIALWKCPKYGTYADITARGTGTPQ